MSRSRTLRAGLSLVIFAAVIYLFGRVLAGNWEAVRQIDLQFNGYSVAAVLLFAVAVVISGLLWGAMTTHLGGGRIDMLEAVRVHSASWLLKYIPGQVGSVTNKVLWAGQRGISRTLVLISFVYENVFLLIGSIVPTFVILLLADSFVGSGDETSMLLPAVLALVPLILVTDRRVFRWAVKLIARRALKQDVPQEYFLSSRAALGYQLAFLLPRVVNGVGFVLIARSFLDVESSAYLPLAATYVLAGAVGILAVFVPSGLGVRESVIVLLASRYMPVEQAIVLSLLARLYSTIGDGIVALVYAGLKARQVHQGASG